MSLFDQNPRGGLSAAGRAKFKREDGSNLKPGVQGVADTPEKMRRKGSFLSRFYGRSDVPPLTKPNGDPTRYALAAHAWGESVPTSLASVRALAAKGKALLARYEASQSKKAG